MSKGKGEATYQKMIDVSIYYFAKDGIQKTSFSKIAEALHMTKPSLYYYVKSKDELIGKVFDYIFEDYIFNSYFEKKALVENGLEKYLIEGGLQFIQEVDEQDIILNLLNEFTLYANRVKHIEPAFYRKIVEAKQSFNRGFEDALVTTELSSDEIELRAATLALMLDNIRNSKALDNPTAAEKLWEYAVKTALANAVLK